MDKQKAKVSINRRGNHKGSGSMCIDIVDALSGLCVAEVEMTLPEFAECITGLASCEGEFNYIANEHTVQNYGKKYETMTVHLETELTKLNDEEELRVLIRESVPEGWFLARDGMRSQQNKRGFHLFHVARYVEVDTGAKT